MEVWLDGHSILVTPDPVPNSEVKLDMFGFVLSLMGRLGAVYLFFNMFMKDVVFNYSIKNCDTFGGAFLMECLFDIYKDLIMIYLLIYYG